MPRCCSIPRDDRGTEASCYSQLVYYRQCQQLARSRNVVLRVCVHVVIDEYRIISRNDGQKFETCNRQ